MHTSYTVTLCRSTFSSVEVIALIGQLISFPTWCSLSESTGREDAKMPSAELVFFCHERDRISPKVLQRLVGKLVSNPSGVVLTAYPTATYMKS